MDALNLLSNYLILFLQNNFTLSSCKSLLGSIYTFQILDFSLTNSNIYLTELWNRLNKIIRMKVHNVEFTGTKRNVSGPYIQRQFLAF